MSTSQLLALVISLVLAAIIVLPLGKALRAHPSPFYLVFIVLTALYLWAVYTGVNLNPVRPLAAILQKGYLSVILLLVVMFTGVFDEGSAARKKLQPIRGELSVLSFVLILGHLFTYLPSYLGRLTKLFTSNTTVAISLVVAFILTALFLVLAAMSLRVVRDNMDKHRWKTIQRLAYLMMVLLAVHIGMVLGGSAFAGGGFKMATLGFFSYLAVLAVYAVLRIRKALRDNARKQAQMHA